MKLPDDYVDEVWANKNVRANETFRAILAELIDNSTMTIEGMRKATVAIFRMIESSLDWQTTCVSCASLMDNNYDMHVKLDQIRRVLNGEILEVESPQEDTPPWS